MAAALSACAEPNHTTTVVRLASQPTKSLDQALGTGSPERVLGFPASGTIAPWSVNDLQPLDTDSGARKWVVTAEADPYLAIEADIEASRVASVRAELRADRRGEAKLFWTRKGEGYSEERQVTTYAARGQSVDFEVRSHPLWDGTITRLRLDPPSQPGTVVELAELRLFGLGSLAEAAATPDPLWIDLSAERRAGWLIAEERCWTADRPHGEKVISSFAFGQVSANGALGSATLALEFRRAKTGKVITSWAGTTAGSSQWTPVVVDLGRPPRGPLEVCARARPEIPEEILPALATLELYGVDGSVDRSMSQRARTR
jgi:hypothetical protein